MRNYIENLKDKMAHSWGFEHPATITFFRWCEKWGNIATQEAADLEFWACNCDAMNQLSE